MRRPKIGEHVIYCDPKGIDHDALVTADWGRCVNVVYVLKDETRQDQYGRQIDRNATSVADYDSEVTVHGRYWRYADQEKIAYKPPIAS